MRKNLQKLIRPIVIWSISGLAFMVNHSMAQVASYSFSQSTGTYTPVALDSTIAVATTTGTGATSLDDVVYTLPVGTIPFPFNFNGTDYTGFNLSTNGFMTFGATAPTTTTYTPISTATAYAGAISPVGRDLHSYFNLAGRTGSIGYATVGTAPNREFVVQYSHFRPYAATAMDPANFFDWNFQIRLKETTNQVSLVYDLSVIGTATAANTVQVGLRGSATTDFNNRTSTTDWSATIAGTVNTATTSYSSTLLPISGLTFTYIPPTASTITSTTTGGNWSSPATWVGGIVPNFQSDVVIDDGATVTVDVSPSIKLLTVGQGASGILNFNAAAARNLQVSGNVTVATGGSITSVPTTGTAVRQITLTGNFTNNGNCNLSEPNFALSFFGSTPQTMGGTGTLAVSNGLGQLQVNNPAGVTLNVPVRISFNLDLIAGDFNTGTNLTFNHLIAPRPAFGTGHTIRRSPFSQIIGTPTYVSDTVVLNYVFFVGQTPDPVISGAEIPASRNVYRITVSNAGGLTTQGGNITVTAATTALTLTSGIITVPSPDKLIFTAGTYAPPVGSDASHINGKMELTVNSSTSVTRNFPVGSNGFRGLVALGGLNTGGANNTISVEPLGTPSGSVVAPLTATIGTRAYRITSSQPFPGTATVQLNWTSFDNLTIGTINQLRVAQGTSLTGTSNWTERSAATGTGAITATGSRTTTTGVDPANGEFFAFGTTAVGDISVTGIQQPNPATGCYSATEPVQVLITNVGATFDFSSTPVTVSFSITNPASSTSSLPNVVINSGTLAPGATQSVNFTGTVDMSGPGAYQITAIASGDNNLANDTLRTTITRLPYTASANPSTIPLGTSSTLSVTGTKIIPLRITEFTLFRTGTGPTNPYPAYFPAGDQDYVELTNLSSSSVDISGTRLDFVGASTLGRTFPPGTVVPGNGTVVLSVSNDPDQPSNLFFNMGGTSTTGPLGSTSAVGIIFRDGPGGNVIDAVAANGYTFLPVSGVTSADWSGNIPSTSGLAGASLTIADNNSASNWVISSVANPQTVGTANPGIASLNIPTVSWTGTGGFNANGVTVSTGTLNTPGTNNYLATIDDAGCISTASASVIILAPALPVAGFTASSLTATIGGTVSTVTFTDTSLNLPTGWQWSFTPSTVTFTGSTSATSQNPQVQFGAADLYTVKLVVTNASGADSVTKTDYITVTGSYCGVSFPSNVEPITLVNFAGLNKTTPNTVGGTSPVLLDYTSDTAFVSQGLSYPITLKGNTDGNFVTHLKVFVDWNGDFDFTDPDEEYYIGTITNSTGLDAVELLGNIQVPATAPIGTTRMRVIKRWNEPNVTSCNAGGYGQAQDFSITVSAAPACIPPSGIAIGSITTTGASVSWTAGTGNTSFEVQYGTTGFTLGTGTIVSPAVSPQAISGLAASTPYQVYVRGICSPGDSTAWTGPVAFTTACAVASLPYTENFDSVTAPAIPACISLETNGGSAWSTRNSSGTSPLVANSQPNQIITYYNATLPKDDWFFTPAFTLTGGETYKLEFYVRAPGYLGTPERLEVKYGSAATSASMLATAIFSDAAMQIPNWTLKDALFIPATSGDYYFGFHAFTVADVDYIAVDDISLTLVTGFAANDINSDISVYPNPAKGEVFIKMLTEAGSSVVTLTDVTGNTVRSYELSSEGGRLDQAVNIDGIAAGVYFLKILNGDKAAVKKLVIE